MARPVALTLSGGGARGFFHLGILKGLNELGITPEKINGTSAGALTGAFYAAGYQPDEIAQIFKSVLVKTIV